MEVEITASESKALRALFGRKRQKASGGSAEPVAPASSEREHDMPKKKAKGGVGGGGGAEKKAKTADAEHPMDISGVLQAAKDGDTDKFAGLLKSHTNLSFEDFNSTKASAALTESAEKGGAAAKGGAAKGGKDSKGDSKGGTATAGAGQHPPEQTALAASSAPAAKAAKSANKASVQAASWGGVPGAAGAPPPHASEETRARLKRCW